jgi:hypothetical protein
MCFFGWSFFFFNKCPPIYQKIDEDFFVNTLERKKAQIL